MKSKMNLYEFLELGGELKIGDIVTSQYGEKAVVDIVKTEDIVGPNSVIHGSTSIVYKHKGFRCSSTPNMFDVEVKVEYNGK